MTIENPQRNGHRRLAGINKDSTYTYRGRLKRDIDICISCPPKTFEEFLSIMQTLGYTFEERGSFLRVNPKGAERFWRLDRLGEGYSEFDIKSRIKEQWYTPKDPRYKVYRPTGFAPSSLRKLYYHYCYLLKIFPKEYPQNKEAYTQINEDKAKMQRFSNTAHMLDKYKIETFEDLQVHYNELNREYDTLLETRISLYKEAKRKIEPERIVEIKAQTKLITKEMRELRKQKNYCTDVAGRSAGIEAVVKLIEGAEKENINKNNNKEDLQNEHKWRSR